MPEILIVAATKQEISPLLKHFNIEAKEEALFSKGSLSVLITGVGMVNTAYQLGKYSNLDFDYRINLGICGAFDRNLKIGELVNITSDSIAEMGAEDNQNFIPYKDLNLGGTNFYPNISQLNFNSLNPLKKVRSITVNKVHGNDESIKKITSLVPAEVESMEGAAFMRACADSKGNYFQVRAVSNYVEKRDKSKWNIPLAIENLNNFAVNFIKELSQ